MLAAGILIYGYNRENALFIKSFTDRTIGFPVLMTSASQKMDEKISDILTNTTDDFFADEPTKILMLIGFKEEQIHAVLVNFPSKEEGLQRPIFCTLTKQNRDWTFGELIEHLKEEYLYWTKKKP